MAPSMLDIFAGRTGSATGSGAASAGSIAKGAHFRHGDGKFRTGKPVSLADLEDIEAAVPDDDEGLKASVALYQAGQAPPPIDIAIDPEGAKRLVAGKKRLAAARATGQQSIPVRFTRVAEAFGKAAGTDAGKAAPAKPARTLQPIDDKVSHPPFPFDPTVFSRIRPDQVPRFLGVLTDPERWPLQTVKLSSLIAMQNRVDTGKVMAKVANGGLGHEPIVVQLEEGRLHIADGHHDLAAAWLRGEDEKAVRFADLTPVTNVLKAAAMPVTPGTKVRVKPEHLADNWFLTATAGAEGEVIASWIVPEGHEKDGATALAVEWITLGICGLYRGLDAAKVDVVTEETTAPKAAVDKAAKLHLPAIGDVVDFDDDRFVGKGPASGKVAAIIGTATVVIDFGDGIPEDLESVDWRYVTKNANTKRWTKDSGQVMWSVFGKPEDDGVGKAAGAPARSFTLSARIAKTDEDQHLVFGIFSIVEVDGKPIVDREGDVITPRDLEKAAYGHVLNARIAGEMHTRIGVGDLVESFVFTTEKQQAFVAALHERGVTGAVMDLRCVGWWGGYHITDEAVWAKIKAGEYVAWSIGGSGVRTPIEPAAT